MPVSTPILTTKLYIPPTRPELVSRSRLIERLNEGMEHKLTLISAPAGFGKTTLLSEWVDNLRFTSDDLRLDTAKESQIVNRKPVLSEAEVSKIANPQVAWLSLDEGDNDPVRFLTYFIAALQQIEATIGQAGRGILESPQPPPPETLLTALINEIAAIPKEFVLILDDYHVIESSPIDQALIFLLDHLPPQMHLLIATRTDPSLPLSRLRARGQMTELRTNDLRFTLDEAAIFLDRVMELNLSSDQIASLENRTEGWIAGLQLAALSMQGLKHAGDIAAFINNLTSSHRFIIEIKLYNFSSAIA
jgi:LuxR family maltose regulon positive regulatory protein